MTQKDQMRRWTKALALGLPLLVLAAIGCSKSSTPSGSAATVAVAPSAAVVSVNGSQQFSASVTGGPTIAIAATNGAVRASNVVTITTTAAHNVSLGQNVTISGVTDATFNGTFSVSSVPSSTTFTYAETGIDATSGGGTVANVAVTWSVNNVSGGNATVGTITSGGLFTAPAALPPAATATITSGGAVRKSGTVTITTSADHNLVVGEVVILSGVTDATFNGTFQVTTVPSTTTFTYTQNAADATSGSGTVTTFAVTITATSVASTSSTGKGIASIDSGIQVTIAPTLATVGTNETFQFTGTVVGGSNNALNWSVNGVAGGNSSVGTISAIGLYTAPPTAPTTNAATIATTNGAVRTSITTTIAAANGAVRNANVVTITTTAAHGLSVGQSVTIAGVSDSSFNGSFVIGTVPSTTTFTYAQTASNATSGGGTASVAFVTITTTAAHGFTSGQSVTIAGVSDSSFNGTFTITSVPSGSTFTYSQTGPAATSGGGTATSTSNAVTITAVAALDPTRSATASVLIASATDPALTSVAPTTVAQGAVFQDVYLVGTSFISTTAVEVNGAPLPSTAIFQSTTSVLRVRLPASLLVTPGILAIDVRRQSGAATPAQNVTVTPTRPAVVGASPDNGTQGGPAFSFNVNGGYFGPSGSPTITAEFAGSTRAAAGSPAKEARQVGVTIGPADLATAGLYEVGIRNASNPALFAATNLAVRPSAPPAVLGSPIAVGTAPGAIAINQGTGVAVVTNRCSSTISRIDVNTLTTIGSAIPVGAFPTGVAVDDLHNIAVVVNNGNNTGCAGAAGVPSLSIVDLAAGSVTATVTANLGAGPISVGVNPLTGLALIVYQSTNHADILDLTQTPPAIVSTATISTGVGPQVAVNQRLNWAVVTPGGGGALSIVDLSRRATAAVAATNGATRASGVTTVTTTTAHPFQQNQVVFVTGMADASFNGVFTVTSVPSTTTFTYAQPALGNASSVGGTVVNTPPVAVASFGISTRGIGINPFTQRAVLADPSSTSITFFNLFDQVPTSLTLPEIGANAAAFNPFTDIAVSVNPNTNQASIIDPQIPTRITTLPIGAGARAVAIDPGTNTALVVNETDGTVTAIGLGALRSLHISAIAITPLSRQLAPAITLASSSDLQLTLLGKGFVNGSQVRLNGVALAPPLTITDRLLTVTVPFALLAGPKQYVLDVVNPSSLQSNVLELTVVQAVNLVGAGGASCTAPAPIGVAIDGQRNLAVVANSGCNSASVIDLTTGAITATLAVGTTPMGVAISPSAGQAVVTNNGSSNVTLLDLTASPATVKNTTTVGTQPRGVTVNEATGQAIVTNAGSSSLSIVELSDGSVSNTITVDSLPWAVAVDPVRRVAAVAHAGANNVAMVSLNSLSITGRISVQLPTAVVFDPITTNFISNASLGNNLLAINPDTNQASFFRTGINPTSIGYNFAAGTLVVVNTASATFTVVDMVDEIIRDVLEIPGSQQFSVAIHPVTNLAVVADQNNHRVLLVPLPR